MCDIDASARPISFLTLQSRTLCYLLEEYQAGKEKGVAPWWKIFEHKNRDTQLLITRDRPVLKQLTR